MPISEGGRFSPNDRIVSPGVFTRENDLSGIAQGVADIGGAVVAPFPKGPGFAPTLVRNVTDLEEKFGVADGVYYGPYCAKEYLIERGVVTVCRVGALTGYHQKYPLVIYAEKGTWGRNGDVGYFVPATSVLTPVSGTIPDGYSGSFMFGAEQVWAVGTESYADIYITASLTVKMQPGAATGVWTDPLSPSSSGSLLYYGQTIPLGEVILHVPTASGASMVAHDPTGSAGLSGWVYASLRSGSFAGDFEVYSLIANRGLSVTSPFVGALITGSLQTIAIASNCDPYIVVSGSISGSFGTYNEFTSTGTPVFDPCTGLWSTGSEGSDYKILAVLADTQYGGINTSLEAPGFISSSITEQTPDPTNSSSISPDLTLTLSSSAGGGYGMYQFSIDASSPKYITNVFGTDPLAGDPDKYVAGTKKEAAYLYSVFENDMAAVNAARTGWKIKATYAPSSSIFTGEPLQFVDDYSLNPTAGDSTFALTNAYTPWVVSQQIASVDGSATATRFKLFKLHTLSDGTPTNKSYKIEISNVKLAGTVPGSDWGSFTLTVRKYSDTDKKPVILEQFNNLNLNPDSSNYVLRRIGDRYNYIDYKGKILEFGTYDNNSRYIRVEVNDNPWPTAAVPYGFEAYITPINSSAGYWSPVMKYTKASVYGSNPGKYPSGITFDDAPSGADAELLALYPTASSLIGASDDNKQYFAPIPEFGAYVSTGRNTAFALDENYTSFGVRSGSFISASNAVPAVYDSAKETTYVKMRKFVFGFQGGFDGQSPAIPINVGGDIIPGNTQGLNCANISSAGSVAYKQCIGALGNADEFDINLIVTPGIIHEHHSYVTTLVVDMCETRGDCFYIMDLYSDDGNPSSGQIDSVVSLAEDFDTSYAAAYYPWVKIKDTNTNKIVTLPPSAILPAVYANNDRVAAEWFAVAGLNRGGIPNAVQVTDRTTHQERDTLYEGRVNPIAAFPGQGICVWGQKTLQVAASALDRVNVRRLLINLKKFFASTSKYLVFEQNTTSTRNKFLSIVNPYLESVQQRSGLYAFQVVMDDSNNTPDIIDRNILYGQIWLKPTKTAEFIILDFNILPTGASFPNA